MNEKAIFLWECNCDKIKIYALDEIEYWIRRKNEKGPGYPESVYVLGEKIDIDPIIAKIRREDIESELRSIEEKEKSEYKRLKEKFEKEDT